MSSLASGNTKVSSNAAGISFANMQLDTLTHRLSPFLMECVMEYLTGSSSLSPHADLVTCNSVSKTWYKLSNSNYLWENLYRYRFGSEDQQQPLNKYMSAVARNNQLQQFAPVNSAFIANAQQPAAEEASSANKPKVSKFNWKKQYIERGQMDRLLFDVKPSDIEVDLTKIESQIRSIQVGEGGRDVKWMRSEIKPLCFGVKFLQMEAHINKMVQFEQIEERIMALEGCKDKISSVDLRGITKIRTKLTTVIKPRGLDYTHGSRVSATSTTSTTASNKAGTSSASTTESTSLVAAAAERMNAMKV